jgi:ferredoxin--NADP+ reductase
MQAVGQDPAAARASMLEALPKAAPRVSETKFRFEFLASPVQMIADENGRLAYLELEDNTLELKGTDTKARGTGNKRLLAAETVIFAIGDKVDDTFGLPIEWNEFVKNPAPRFPVDGISYEAYDPQTKQPIADVFVGGWSRQASSGLVGYARKDGTNASRAVWQYLQTLPPNGANTERLGALLERADKPIVRNADVKKLEAVEKAEAEQRGLEEFKFASNEEMLKAIGL